MRIFPFFICVLFVNLSFGAVNVSDSLALVDLYNSTNGQNWKSKGNWLSGSVTGWKGIVINNNRVVGIHLVNNGLTGVLPSSIENLTALKSLILSRNRITGQIPPQVFNLPELLLLYLNYNEFEGAIPSNIGNAKKLDELYLDHNKLTGSLPASIRYLTVLTEMVLSYNKLSGTISPDLGDNSRLEKFELNNNQFSGSIPSRLSRIPNLTSFKFNNNLLTGEIPTGLMSAVCYTFDVSSNQLSGQIPSDIGSNGTLALINLSNNAFTGSIPASISSLSNLHALDLSKNQLSGTLPSALGNLKMLVKLNLANNMFTGTVPGGLCSNVNLQLLNLSNNQFTFDGLECLGKKNNESLITNYSYQNQKTLTLNEKNGILSLSAGGTLSNNTYAIYKDDVLIQSVQADSTFLIAESGEYWVDVTNNLASGLILHSTRIGVENVVLPLNWLGIKAVDCSGDVCVEWKTENEVNTAYFDVERSTDGIRFEKIGTVPSANTGGQHTYNSTDYAPAYGVNYYRVKQTDLDGTYTYSKIVNININPTGAIKVTPNPANNYILLSGILKADKIDIVSMTGQVMYQWRNVAGNQQLNISNLPAGIYIIKIMYSGRESNHKLVKQ